MQNPYITEALAAEHRRQLLEEPRKGSLAKARPGRPPWVHIHFVRRTASVVLAICSSSLGFVLFAPSAFGLMLNFRTYANGRAPSLAGAVPAVSQPHPTIAHTVVTGGMAGWLITLIAVGAALLAATVAVLMDRARGANRKPSVSAA
jgi:hypothetical protein